MFEFLKTGKGADSTNPNIRWKAKTALFASPAGAGPPISQPGQIEQWVRAFATETRNMAVDEFTVGRDPITVG